MDSRTTEKVKTQEQQEQRKHRRTLGLRLFDVGLYPILTNFGVFVISVAATYLTSHGGDRNTSGKLIFGEVGQWFQHRGERLMAKFQSWGMSHDQADMSKMVAFSFIDGSIMAPFVKLLEDRREKIAKRIDEYLGTVPKDMSVYDAEPKQGWGSVLGGRLATALVVVPTAVAMDRVKFKDGTNLNDKFFKRPGKKLGRWVESKPDLRKYFGSLHIPGLFATSAFEAFYTSVCTAGLYFSSRFFARHGSGKKTKSAANAPAELAALPVAHEEEKLEKADHTVGHVARHVLRQAQAEELAARGV